MTPNTHTFRPWTTGQNGTRILAPQRKWAEVERWNRDAEKAGVRERVEIGECDLFDGEFDGIWRDDEGNEIACDEVDVAQKVFRLIDATPHLVLPLVTRYPQNVLGTWPSADVFDSKSEHKAYWPNVHLYARITDQASADAAIPELLRLRDLTPVLGVDGVLTGSVDFERVQWPGQHRVDVLRGGYWEDRECFWKGFVNHSDMPGTLNHIRIRGETGHNARPLHPQWVRSARDQCVAANVAFAFDGWGEWVDLHQSPECNERRNNGHNPGFCPIGLNGRPVPISADRTKGEVTVYKFGPSLTGRLLDGREWRETPE